MRHQLSPGVTYSHRSTLSFPAQPVVGRGAQTVHIKEEPVSTTPSTSSAAEGVRAAVADGRILASEAADWTARLEQDPSAGTWLEQLAAVPGLNDEPASLAAASVPTYTDMSAGDYRQGHPANAPKLFDNGDLPVMTASGVDLDLLRQVPWQARPAVACAKTHTEVHELVTRYSGELGQIQADVDALGGGPLYADVNEYENRLEEWGSWEATDAEASQLTGGRTEELKKNIDAWSVEQSKSRNQPDWPWADPIDMFKGGQPRRYLGPVERKGK